MAFSFQLPPFLRDPIKEKFKILDGTLYWSDGSIIKQAVVGYWKRI
jgi:hypothetical protein